MNLKHVFREWWRLVFRKRPRRIKEFITFREFNNATVPVWHPSDLVAPSTSYADLLLPFLERPDVRVIHVKDLGVHVDFIGSSKFSVDHYGTFFPFYRVIGLSILPIRNEGSVLTCFHELGHQLSLHQRSHFTGLEFDILFNELDSWRWVKDQFKTRWTSQFQDAMCAALDTYFNDTWRSKIRSQDNVSVLFGMATEIDYQIVDSSDQMES